MTISSRNLVRRSGASYRQLDHWTRLGIIKPIGDSCPGSGHVRQWDDNIVGLVMTIGKVSRALGSNCGGGILEAVAKHYDQGFVNLTDGIQLRWRVDGQAEEDGQPSLASSL